METKGSFTVFTRACHWYLFWAGWIQSTAHHIHTYCYVPSNDHKTHIEQLVSRDRLIHFPLCHVFLLCFMDYHCHYTRQAPWMKKLCYLRYLHDTVTCDSQGCCASGTNGHTHRIRSSAARRSVCQPCDAGGTRHVWSSCDTGGSTEDHLLHCYCQPSPFLVALQWDEQRKGLSMAGKPIPPPPHWHKNWI